MLLALGYHLTFDPQYTSNHRLKTMKLPNKSVNSQQDGGSRELRGGLGAQSQEFCPATIFQT